MVDRFVSQDFNSMNAHKMNMVYMLFVDKLENMFWNRFENPDIDTNKDFEYLLTDKENPIRFGFHGDIKNRYKCDPAVSYSDTHREICLSFYECISTSSYIVGSIRIFITTGHVDVIGSLNPIFDDFKRDLDNFMKDVEFIYNMKPRELWKKSICDIFLEYQYHVADRLVSGQISLADFLEKAKTEDFFIDVLNYSNTIYRIYGDSRIPMITVKELLTDCMCNHMYEWEAVEKSRMFYVENCDLQAVDVPSMTDLDDMVEYDDYKIIDIVL